MWCMTHTISNFFRGTIVNLFLLFRLFFWTLQLPSRCSIAHVSFTLFFLYLHRIQFQTHCLPSQFLPSHASTTGHPIHHGGNSFSCTIMNAWVKISIFSTFFLSSSILLVICAHCTRYWWWMLSHICFEVWVIEAKVVGLWFVEVDDCDEENRRYQCVLSDCMIHHPKPVFSLHYAGSLP